MKVTCKQQKARAIKKDKDELSTSSGDEYAYALEGVNKFSTETQLKLNDLFDLTFQGDTGATVNIIDSKTYETLQHQIKLESAQTKIFACGFLTPLPLKGCLRQNHATPFCNFTLSKGNLISGQTANELTLIHLVHKVNKSQTTDSINLAKEQLKEKKSSLQTQTKIFRDS